MRKEIIVRKSEGNVVRLWPTICEDCFGDESISQCRVADVQCQGCGAMLCGGHIMKHLRKKHSVRAQVCDGD